MDDLLNDGGIVFQRHKESIINMLDYKQRNRDHFEVFSSKIRKLCDSKCPMDQRH